MQDDMLMIDPDRCLIICGMTARLTRYTPRTLTRITRSNSSGSVSTISPTPPMPALLKSTSIRSNRLTTLSARATVCASSVTSTCSATASPAAPIASTVPCAASRSTSATTTRPPSLTKSEALARPIPEPAPVITHTLPSSLPICGVSYMLKLRCLSTGRTRTGGVSKLGTDERPTSGRQRVQAPSARRPRAQRDGRRHRQDSGAHRVGRLGPWRSAAEGERAGGSARPVPQLATRTLRVRLWHGRTADDALEVTREEHRRIYEAIMQGDPELARAAATAHIASGERWLRRQVATGASA